VTGNHRSHVIAYARVHEQKAAIVIALRNFVPLTDAGRQWPKFDAIDAQVPLDESDLLVDTLASDHIAVGTALSHVPAVVLLGNVKPSRVRVAPFEPHAEPARNI